MSDDGQCPERRPLTPEQARGALAAMAAIAVHRPLTDAEAEAWIRCQAILGTSVPPPRDPGTG